MGDSEEGIRCVGAERTFRCQLTKGASVRDLAAQVTSPNKCLRGSTERMARISRSIVSTFRVLPVRLPVHCWQLAAETGQAGSLNIRIFCRGRELRHHELAASIGTSPVHFVLCPDGPLSRGSSVDFGAAGVLAHYDLPAEPAEDQDAWVRTRCCVIGFASYAHHPRPPPPLRLDPDS